MSQGSGFSLDLRGPSPSKRARSSYVSNGAKCFNEHDAKYIKLLGQQQKAVAAIPTKGRTPWSLFDLNKVYDEEGVTTDVRMICITCATSLVTSNPSQSQKNHLNDDKTMCVFFYSLSYAFPAYL